MDSERHRQALQRLGALALAAEEHARERLGGAEADMDRALDASRDPDEREPLVVCYGAWLGERLRRDFGATWTGLFEPAAPRLLVRGRMISPMDAVRRRLASTEAPTLATLIETVGSWEEPRGTPVEENRKAWDARASSDRFTGLAPQLLEREAALEALDPWVADEGVGDKRVLCLAAGGGRQAPLHAAAGAASVTVVDLSDAQLERDRALAEQHGWPLRTVCTSMDDLHELADASFDIAIHPVATSYVADLGPVHRELARVLRPGGLYVAQHKQPSMTAEGTTPYVEGAPLPPGASAHREKGCAEFVHTLEGLMGGLCRSGFVIEDVVEPPLGDALAPEGSFEKRAAFTPPYIKVKARRRE